MHLRPRRCGYSVVLALIPFALAGCGMLPTHVDIALVLPKTPNAWREAWGEPQMRVRWQAAGEAGALAGVAEPGATVVLTVPRRPPIALIAEPIWAAGGPAVAEGEAPAFAGAVWEAVGVQTISSYRDGALACVVNRLLHAGIDLRRFSVRRLRAEIALRLPDDPWALDVDRVVEAIADGAMRESYVRGREAVETGLIAPPGTWFPVSPFTPAIPGGERWPPLPVGVSVFYSDDGRRALVLVDDEERAWQPDATE